MTLSNTASASVYDTCKAITDANNASQDEKYDAMLQCVGDSNANSIDVFFLIYASSLVFFMQAGFAMLCAGSVQLKNVQNSMLKNLLDACGEYDICNVAHVIYMKVATPTADISLCTHALG